MDFLNKVSSIIKEAINKIFFEFDGMDGAFLLLILLSAGMLSMLVIRAAVYKRRKRRLTVIRNRNYFISGMISRLKTNRFCMKVLGNISVKLCMLNKYSYEKNIENAFILCLFSIFIFLSSVLIFIPSVELIWYVTLTYIFMAAAFMVIIFIIFTFAARLRFTSKLPETYKLLNSRYITTGNILKAINASLDDFDKSVKREMYKVYNVLKKNDMGEIENTIMLMEKTYRNEYVTLLLNLIIQAHYKGGDGAIKRQFENTTEEILADIENQKDLSFTARIYMLLAILLPIGVKWFESFNHRALGDKAVEFYSSPLGMEIKLIFYISFFIYLGMLLFMERTA